MNLTPNPKPGWLLVTIPAVMIFVASSQMESSTLLPTELVNADSWLDAQDVPAGPDVVLARVDLGQGAFADPVPSGLAVPAAAPAAVDAGTAALQQQIAALQAQQAAAAAPAAPAAGATPGAPMVAGMPAKLVSGSSAKGPWQAWADPRPKEATDHMQKTDDVNHPGLALGSHKLWKFIR